MDILIFIASFLIFSGFGSRIIKIFGADAISDEEIIFLSIALGFGLVSYLIFAAGLSGLLYKKYLFILLLVIAAVSWKETIRFSGHIFRLISRGSKNIFSGEASPYERFILAFIFLAAAATFVGALVPPLGNDSLAYRLAQVRIYADDHIISYVPYTRESLWPNLTEMLFTYSLVLGTDVLAKLFAWGIGIITCYGVFAVSKTVFSKRAAILSSAVYLLTPIVFTQMGYAYVDISMALYSFACLLAFTVFIRERTAQWACLTGIFAGFVMSVKYSGVIPMSAMSFLFFFCLLLLPHKKDLIRGMIIALFFGFLFCCSWYLRAYIVKGNPVYPYLAEMFSGNGWQRNAENIVGSRFSIKDLLALPWQLTMFPARFGGESVGVFFLVFSPLIFFIKNVRKAMPYIIFTVVYLGMWFFVDPYVVRFIFPALLPLSVLEGGGIDAVLTGRQIYSRIIRSSFVCVCLLSMSIMAYHIIPVVKVAVGLEARNSFLSRKERTYEVAVYINKNTPENSNILLVNEIRTYYIDRPYVHLRNLVDEEKIPEENVNDASFGGVLGSFGVDYVLYLEGGKEYPWVEELVRNGKTVHEHVHYGIDGRVYRYKVLKIG
ncbi:MAG: phospholipid carrier-dependent glycosyltransferase [Candidatus Omnitrophica bacterium]|nr:phospholipid carrier-dependent glycosyltransferase [Candidatus Omnitrophota bacterium]